MQPDSLAGDGGTADSRVTRRSVVPATAADTDYVYRAFEQALSPFYGGDHRAHARRVIRTHLEGRDTRGLLSTQQVLLILWDGGERRGVLNLVFKRQRTCKISPLILYPDSERSRGLGAVLLDVAEERARQAGSRHLYCTVAESNRDALVFFEQSGFTVCGRATAQYKDGETELLLRRPLMLSHDPPGQRQMISVTEVRTDEEWRDVRKLLLGRIGRLVDGAGAEWLDSLRHSSASEPPDESVERRRAWVYCARDRTGTTVPRRLT